MLAPVRSHKLRVFTERVLDWASDLGVPTVALRSRYAAAAKRRHVRQVLQLTLKAIADAPWLGCSCGGRVPHASSCFMMEFLELEFWSVEHWGVGRRYDQRAPHRQGEEIQQLVERDWRLGARDFNRERRQAMHDRMEANFKRREVS